MDKINTQAKIFYNNALSLIEVNNITNAVNELEKSVYLNPNDSDSLNVLGLCCYFLCDFNSAFLYWKRSSEINKSDNRSRLYLEFLQSNKFNNLVIQYNNGLEKINEEKIDEAISIFENISKGFPDLIEPYIILGLCHYYLQDTKKAFDYWQKARYRDRGNMKLNDYLLCIQSQTPEWHYARNSITFIYRYAAAIIISALLIFGGYYYGNFRNKVYKDEYMNLINKEKHYIEEIANLKNSEKKKTEEYEILNEQLKILQDEKSNMEKKIKEPEAPNVKEDSGITLPVKNEQSMFEQAMHLYYAGDYSNALERFKSISEYGIEDHLVAESMYFAARCYEKSDDIENSIKLYKEYILKYRERNYYDDSLYNCGLLLYRSGHTAEAVEILKVLSDEYPESIFNNSVVKRIIN